MRIASVRCNMTEPKTSSKHHRQVTTQPQEPPPPKGDPAKPAQPKPARKAAPGQQDRRSAKNRDGNE
jgi:hypothetical protein